MHPNTRSLAALTLAASLAAACGAAAGPSMAPTPTPAPTAAPAATPTPTPEPTPTPTPLTPTDGQGDEYVAGDDTLTLTTPYTSAVVNGVTQYRDGVITIVSVMNDPRVSGTATWKFSIDVYSTVGLEWGPYHLQNDKGAWDGTCSGGTWNAGSAIISSCWLAGSGDYAGHTYYRQFTGREGFYGRVEGIIYPGSPPAP